MIAGPMEPFQFEQDTKEVIGATVYRKEHETTSRIEDLDFDVLSNILALAVTDLKGALSLCQTSHHMRLTAFSTREIWDTLAVAFEVFCGNPCPVRPLDVEFMRWWAAIVWFNKSTDFALQFIVKIAPGKHTILDASTLQAIAGLFACARHLVIDSEGLTFIRNSVQAGTPIPLPLLENLIIHDTSGDVHSGGCGALWYFSRLFAAPAIRSLKLPHDMRETSTHTPYSVDRRDADIACSRMWEQLTEIDVSLWAHMEDWNKLLGQCTLLKCARIVFNVDRSYPALFYLPISRTVPALTLLDLRVNSGFMNFDITMLFRHVSFPVLKSLILRPTQLSLEALHRLLRSTPALEQLRLACSFPTVGDGFPITNLRLVQELPRLQLLTVDITGVLLDLNSSLGRYIDQLERSGWLAGSWANGALTFAFYWPATATVFPEWPTGLSGFSGVNVIIQAASPGDEEFEVVVI